MAKRKRNRNRLATRGKRSRPTDHGIRCTVEAANHGLTTKTPPATATDDTLEILRSVDKEVAEIAGTVGTAEVDGVDELSQTTSADWCEPPDSVVGKFSTRPQQVTDDQEDRVAKTFSAVPSQADRFDQLLDTFQMTLGQLQELPLVLQRGVLAGADGGGRTDTLVEIHVVEMEQQLEAFSKEVEDQAATIDQLRHELSGKERLAADLQQQIDERLSETLFPKPSEDELEALRMRIAELEHENHELLVRCENSKAPSSSLGCPPQPPAEALTWEEQKQVILQRLEQEEGQVCAGGAADQKEIVGELQQLRHMVQQADEEIQRRDRQIADLRELLDDQSKTFGNVAIGANAIGELLEQDDLIREEREKLREIQQEWQAKLSQAEVEVSLERARLARERMELEKRNHELECQQQEQARSHSDQECSETSGKPRRRWLAKLGLDQTSD